MRPVRVGVLLDEPRVRAWLGWIVRAIADHPDLTLALVVERQTTDAPTRSLFAAYERLDRWLFGEGPDALAWVDVSAELVGTPRGSLGDVRAHDLDVLLHLDGPRPDGPVLDAVRYGVWSYRHGAAVGAAAPMLDELSSGAGEVETVLEILGHGADRIIYRSTSATDAISLHRTRVPAYWKSARFALRRLEDLSAGRWEPDGVPTPDPAARSTPPTAARTLRHVATVASRAAGRKLRATALQYQWFLGFRARTTDRLPQDDPAPWRLTFPPRDRSYADPFVIRHDGATFVFFEVLPHARPRGELAVGRLEDDGTLTAITPILPAAHHTSYPYVFVDGGAVYLIPESGEARRVDLFRAVDFPFAWEHVATLLDGVNAVDASVHHDGARYWMWVSIAVPGGRPHDETFLYMSERLDGGWTSHPCNPVISDVRRGRAAGRPFVHDGRLIRPAQDCSGRYGRQVVFNHVEELDPDHYRERAIGRLGPDWAQEANLAAHTYTFDGEWEASDGLRTFSRLPLRARY